MFNLISKIQAASLGQIGEGSNLLLKSNIYDETSSTFNWMEVFNFGAQVLFLVAAIACFVYLVMGGVTMITSEGEAAKKAKARNQIVFAAIGLLVVGAAFAIWRLILAVVGMSDLKTGF